MSETKTNLIVVKRSELEYVYSALDLLTDISKELQFKEPSISKRIANLSVGGKNTIRKYVGYKED